MASSVRPACRRLTGRSSRRGSCRRGGDPSRSAPGRLEKHAACDEAGEIGEVDLGLQQALGDLPNWLASRTTCQRRSCGRSPRGRSSRSQLGSCIAGGQLAQGLPSSSRLAAAEQAMTDEETGTGPMARSAQAGGGRSGERRRGPAGRLAIAAPQQPTGGVIGKKRRDVQAARTADAAARAEWSVVRASCR